MKHQYQVKQKNISKRYIRDRKRDIMKFKKYLNEEKDKLTAKIENGQLVAYLNGKRYVVRKHMKTAMKHNFVHAHIPEYDPTNIIFQATKTEKQPTYFGWKIATKKGSDIKPASKPEEIDINDFYKGKADVTVKSGKWGMATGRFVHVRPKHKILTARIEKENEI